jgi:hydrogenase-4 component B
LAYLAFVSTLASGILALGADRYPNLLRYGSSILLGLNGLTEIVAGDWALIDETPTIDQLAHGLRWLKWHLRIDSLSGFFFSIVGLLVFAISLFAPGHLREYIRHDRKQSLAVLGLSTGLFTFGMYMVRLADDAFVFMISWELMSIEICRQGYQGWFQRVNSPARQNVVFGRIPAISGTLSHRRRNTPFDHRNLHGVVHD